MNAWTPLHCTAPMKRTVTVHIMIARKRQFSGVEKGRQAIKSGSANVRNSEAINIDCLTPENIKYKQDKQPDIQMIKQWKRDDSKPQWSQVAKYVPELKAYWSSWKSLILMDEVLYKKNHG